MELDSQSLAVIFAGIVSVVAACFTGIKFSRCTKITCPCCALEREVIEQENVAHV